MGKPSPMKVGPKATTLSHHLVQRCKPYLQGNRLTKTQEQMLVYILGHVLQCGYQPSYREIGREFGIKTPNGVACHLRALRHKGFVGESVGARAIDLSIYM